MVRLRAAHPDDALAVAQMNVRAWQVGYRGLLPEEYLETLQPADRAARYDFGASDPAAPVTVVAVEDQAILGFATTAVRHDQVGSVGEVMALYVDPERWGHGVGRLLVSHARARLLADGCRHAVLHVLVGNQRAASFYRADGWIADGERRQEQIWGVTVEITRYRRSLP